MSEDELLKVLSKERVFVADCEPWETYDPKDLEDFTKAALSYFLKINVIEVTANQLSEEKYGHSGTELIIRTDKFSFKTSDYLASLYANLWDILSQIQECHKVETNMSFCSYLEAYDMSPTIAYVTKDELDYLLKNDGFSDFPYEIEETDSSFKVLLDKGEVERGRVHRRIADVEIIALSTNEKITLDPVSGS